MKHDERVVVGIDPTYRGFAYAVLRGVDYLDDWGLVHVVLRTDQNILARVEDIIDRSTPDVLVVEDGRGTRRKARARRIIKGIEEIARERDITLVRVSRSHVRKVFAPRETKQEIAEALSHIFPELAPRLPRPRKPWTSEDERMGIFDALSLAIASFSK